MNFFLMQLSLALTTLIIYQWENCIFLNEVFHQFAWSSTVYPTDVYYTKTVKTFTSHLTPYSNGPKAIPSAGWYWLQLLHLQWDSCRLTFKIWPKMVYFLSYCISEKIFWCLNVFILFNACQSFYHLSGDAFVDFWLCKSGQNICNY